MLHIQTLDMEGRLTVAITSVLCTLNWTELNGDTLWTLARSKMEEKPEQALLCHDNLDRASPDLWPEQSMQ